MGVEIQVGGAWKEAADRTPVGSIMAFGGTVAPDGWFICDGSTLSRTSYADLYSVIGTNFGFGDGSTTFNLPNLQGISLTGVGSQAINGRSKSGPSLGLVREDQTQGHWHEVTNGTYGVKYGTYGASASGAMCAETSGPGPYSARTPVTDGGNGTPRMGAYTHGPEIGVNFIIKY